MKKGIIMEIDDVHLTLLTPEGEFFRTRRQDHPYTIGEEIHFFSIESVKPTRSFDSFKNIFKLKTVWVVMTALLLFIGSFIPLYQNNKAYAYMTIDANQSIEIGVNKKMQVVELTGFNKEGKKIISNLKDWKKKDVSELTTAIFVEMKNAGFIRNNEHIIISTVRTTQPEEKAEKELQKNMSKIKVTVNNQHADLTLLTATEKEREKAQKLGISTGKYQETKSQSSQKEKQKTIEKVQKQNSLSAEHEEKIPPGQLKKQLENNTMQNSGLIEDKPKNETNQSEGKAIPPGQIKKDEENWNQNNGQLKKQYQQQENTNQQNKGNQGQKEKDSSQENKWKQKEKQNDTNQHNQWNQKDHKNK